jgi:dipeptidyl aminopeptidase/acylaminoacyl peptidase
LISVTHAFVYSAELRPFTSRDAAEMAYFGNIRDSTLELPFDDGAVSPNGRYAVKVTHRGVLPQGVTEGTIWLFDVDDVIRSIEDANKVPSAPTGLASMSAAINGYSNDFANRGNTLLHPKWSNDGKDVYFLGRDGQENRQLFKVNVDSHKLMALSPPNRDVFAYSVSGPHVALLVGQSIDPNEVWQTSGASIDDIVVGTGTALNPLLFPNFLEYANVEPLVLEVWRVQGKTAEPVREKVSRAPIQVVSQFANADISVSPDGRQAVAEIADFSRRENSSNGGILRIIDLESGEFRDSTDLATEGLAWTPFAPRASNDSRRLKLSVSESFNQPPVLMATKTDTEETRAVFDPNPQLAELLVLPVSKFEWEDQHGRTIVGGLLKPANFDTGRRFPLVIQTHGFAQSRFFRVGASDTANAGRALASRDIVVLQVEEPDVGDDVPINLEKAGMDIYLAAIDELASRGIIDPDKVGISGYSFTGLTVATSITRAPKRFAAAVIANADPLTLTGYYSYVDSPLQGLTENVIIGAPPIDDGLQIWLDKSPSLSTGSITAPVLVSATDPFHLLSLWDFYAALRYQGKAVELQYIRSGKHNIVKPLHKVAHQEMIVDWFDFWLNDHEDTDPSKADQYRRWRRMK